MWSSVHTTGSEPGTARMGGRPVSDALGSGIDISMFGFRTLARSLMASVFVIGGLQALRRSRDLAPAADDVAQPIADQIGLDRETESLVRINAGVQIAGGALFAAGVVPRVTGLVLGATLVPTTLAGHPFWDRESTAERDRHLLGFAKNAAILGGLIFAALDTGGRPSIFWSGKQAAASAGETIGSTARTIAETIAPS